MKRIVGLDVARAMAILGMVIVNFKMVFGGEGSPILQKIALGFEGKAAALFVSLAGLGMGLAWKKAISKHAENKYYKQLLKRAVLLFFIGLSYKWLWPADILHFYGLFMLICILLMYMKRIHFLPVAIAFVLAYPFMFIFIDYEQGWDFVNFNYLDFWTVKGFLRNIFFNGFHPIIPWVAFMLFGVWLSRFDFRDLKFLKRSLIVGFFGFLAIKLLSNYLIRTGGSFMSETQEDIELLFGIGPIPPLPLYMFSASFMALFIISASCIMALRFPNNLLVKVFERSGKLALTIYVAHVILGMGIVESIDPYKLGQYSITFSFWYAIAFVVISFMFSHWYLKKYKQGPLEMLLRYLSK